MALGMGLIMLLVGVTMILRSQDDQVTASAQKATDRALGAAETGITRYQSLINNSRVIATYNNTDWASASTITNVENPCTDESETTKVQDSANTSWQYVDDTNATTKKTKGQYRLISYTYQPNSDVAAHQAPGTGRLIVEGRIGQIDNDSGSASPGVSTGITRLQVEIPVKAESTKVPGLWVNNNKITYMANDKVNGDILINSCPPATGATSANLYDPSTQKVIAKSLTLPDTPSLPSSYYTLTDDNEIWSSFPRVGDTPGSDGYYHYLVDKLVNPKGNSEITIQSGKKVIFYVKGNVDLSGNPDINPDLNKTSGNLPSQFQIYGNTYTSVSTTKYGCATGTTLGSGCPTLTAHFNGNGTMKAFFHAPEAVGSVNGGGNTNGNFKGSIWIKDWNASSGNDKVKIDALGSFSDYLAGPKLPPSISSASTWKKQEVVP